jgi:hypothetical protein
MHLERNEMQLWQKNNFFESNKVIVAKWVDKAFQQSFKKKKHQI